MLIEWDLSIACYIVCFQRFEFLCCTVLAVQVQICVAWAPAPHCDRWFPDTQAHRMGAFGDKSPHILSDYTNFSFN